METCSTGPTRQLGNRRQIISHPINCVEWKQDAPHDDTFPIDVHFVQSEFVGQRHVAWLSGSSLYFSFTPGLLLLRLFSYRMTAVTLMQRGTAATRAGRSIAPAADWLQREEILSSNWLVAASHSRFIFRWLLSMDLNSFNTGYSMLLEFVL